MLSEHESCSESEGERETETHPEDEVLLLDLANSMLGGEDVRMWELITLDSLKTSVEMAVCSSARARILRMPRLPNMPRTRRICRITFWVYV